MGKFIFRVIHILFILTGVVIVTSLTDAKVRQKELLAHSHDVYETGELTFMIDGNYVRDEPIYEAIVNENNRSFHVFIYDVVYITTENETTSFHDGIQLIVEQTAGEELPYTTDVTFSGPNEYELVISGMKYYDLPLYVTYDQDNGKIRLNRDELGTNTITDITITLSNETYLTLDVDIDETDLTAKADIETYLETHDILDVNEIEGLTVINFLEINTISAIIRNLAIYVVIATILSALIIFYQKRHLGRGRVNPRLKEDLERLKEKEQLDPIKETER